MDHELKDVAFMLKNTSNLLKKTASSRHAIRDARICETRLLMVS